MIPLPIATGFYRYESLPLSAQRCVNFVPFVPEAPALSDRSLIGTPGIATKTLTGATIVGPNRGAQEMGGLSYWVNGGNLYCLDGSAVTQIGGITGASRVSMANDGQYLVIVVPGITAYSYDSGTQTLIEITDENFLVSDTVVFKDGYFVFTASDGSVFFNSSLTRPLTFDALDFGSAEINPDKIVAAHVNHNELFIAGTETIELFQNVGGADFPFQRIPGANIQKGVHAKHSIVEFDNTFLFAGGGENEKTAIWKVASSANAQKISTAAIDSEIQKFTRTEIKNAFAINYAFGGNFYAAFTFESTRIPSKTFVYDATTSALTESAMWHERQSGVDENRWRAQSLVVVADEMLVGDYETTNIGIIDKDTYTEYGDAIFRQVASMPFSNQGITLFISELQLTMEAGVGLITGQGSAPVIRHDWSDDGGRTFGSEISRSFGQVGKYNTLPTWRRLGRVPQQRVLRFTATDPVKTNILKLEGDAQGGVQ